MSIEERLDRIERMVTLGAKEALSIDETAMCFDMKKSFLYSLVHTKRIPHYKVGRLLFFNKKEVEAFILSNRVSTFDEAESFAATYMAKHKN